MNYFAKNISYLRSLKEITQAQIPNFIDITRGTWSNYELSKSEPNIDQIITISKFFGVTVQELLREDLEAKGNLTENEENNETGNLIGNGKGNRYEENKKFSIINEPGDLTTNSSFKDVIDSVNKMRHDIDRLQRSKDK